MTSGENVFSLGATSLAKSMLGSDGSDLGVSDFRIVSENGSFYVVSGSNSGVILGVYQLLNEMFNFEFFKEGVYTLDHNVTELKYFTIDLTQTAFIDYRADYSGMNLYGSTISSTRLGLTTDDKLVVGDRHNSLTLIDKETYYSVHPNWYSTGGDQLCYTAHGDSVELAALIDTVSDKLVDLLRASGAENKTYARFQMADTKTWCTCDACTAAATTYGSVSGAMLKTCNAIGEAVTRKLNDLGDSRKIRIVLLLYYATENVPVTKDSSGNYTLNSSIGTLEYVAPMWACLSKKIHSKSWFDVENASALDMLNQMEAAFDEYWIWDYGVNFLDYLVPFNTFDNLGKDFSGLKNYHIGLYLYQLANSAHNVTGFNSLKLYLMSKLMFDPTLNQDTLTQKYFDNVYGAGGAKMKQIYDEYLALARQNEQAGWNQKWYSDSMVQKAYWPKETLQRWLTLVDESLQLNGNDGVLSSSATPLANSAEMYERNILTDSVFIRYIYAKLYLQENTTENLAFKQQLLDDVRNLNFYQIRELGSVDNTYLLADELGLTDQ